MNDSMNQHSDYVVGLTDDDVSWLNTIRSFEANAASCHWSRGNDPEWVAAHGEDAAAMEIEAAGVRQEKADALQSILARDGAAKAAGLVAVKWDGIKEMLCESLKVSEPQFDSAIQALAERRAVQNENTTSKTS